MKSLSCPLRLLIQRGKAHTTLVIVAGYEALSCPLRLLIQRGKARKTPVAGYSTALFRHPSSETKHLYKTSSHVKLNRFLTV